MSMKRGHCINDRNCTILYVFKCRINLLMLKVNTSDILSSNITQSAIGALFAVLGPGWLGATVFNAPHNLHIIQNDVGKTIQHMPWLVIILVAVVAMIVISQTATASIMVPIVMSMGIPPMYFVAMVQTLNVNFVIPRNQRYYSQLI